MSGATLKSKDKHAKSKDRLMTSSSKDNSVSPNNNMDDFPEEFSIEDLPSNNSNNNRKNTTMITFIETDKKVMADTIPRGRTPTTNSHLPRGRQPEPEPEPPLSGSRFGRSQPDHRSIQHDWTPGAYSVRGDGQWMVRYDSATASHDEEQGSTIMETTRNQAAASVATTEEEGYQHIVEAQTVETASVAEVDPDADKPPPPPPILVEATETGCSTKWSMRTIYRSIALGVLLLVGMIVVVAVVLTMGPRQDPTISTPTVSPTPMIDSSSLEIACQFLRQSDLTQCQLMTQFESTSVSGTSIPSELGLLTRLEHLEMSQNSLTGRIPSTLGNLSLLTFLSMHTNSLTGSMPSSMSRLTSLTLLSMYSNALTGRIPPSFVSSNLRRLTWLEMGDNDLTGTIPSSIGDLSLLTWLSMYSNSLTGSIPSSMGNLVQLQTVYLSGNLLTGSIPVTVETQLTNLVEFHVGNNSLMGSIPSSFCSLYGALTSLTIDCDEIQCDCCLSRWPDSSFCTQSR